MNVVRIGATAPSDDKRMLLETLDSLREAVEDGSVIGFAAVGIEASDVTRCWKCAPGVTNLRMIGAVSSLQFGILEGQ